ncbi:MAG: hypothetical protein KGJ55_05940 [Gammaproteobacteria bacterium]|nr:hypothetical protein [Gammaproteobacteria bacterium]
MLKAALIENGDLGNRRHFVDNERIVYRHERIARGWTPDFSGDDLVVVPNGADHVALYRAREATAAVLARGGAVACFCGCFTPWLPGTVWIHDNSCPNREVRYHVVADPLGLMHGVDPARLSTESHGISGWWACGYLQTTYPESVVLADTWQRPVLIADTRSTPGLIVATASGPLGEPDPAAADGGGPLRLYRNILRAVAAHQERRHD